MAATNHGCATVVRRAVTVIAFIMSHESRKTRIIRPVAHLDQVLGPTDDTVVFFQPRAMVYVTMLWVVAAVWAVCLALFVLLRVILGDPPGADDIVTYLELALIVPVVFSALILLVAWRRFGWLHTSVHGLDFAATGRKPVHIPWSGVAAVGLRHRGPFTELVVTPVAP